MEPDPTAEAKILRVGFPHLRHFHGYGLKVAAIVDRHLASALDDACRLITFRPDNWPWVLANERPDLVLVESAWRGNDGAWQYQVPEYTHPDAVGLAELLEWCRDRSIPSVFWDTKGEHHVPRFLAAAKGCAAVCTVDPAAAGRWRAHGLEARLVPLGFPLLHGGTGDHGRAGVAMFVYPSIRHSREEADQLSLLVDAGRGHDLLLCAEQEAPDGSATVLPAAWAALAQPWHGYRVRLAELRRRKVLLSGPSWDYPRGTLSPGVIDAIACGCAVISTPNDQLTALLGDAVPIVSDAEGARDELERLLGDEDERAATAAKAALALASDHGYRRRLEQLARVAGLHG
jgi:hypothetical protein